MAHLAEEVGVANDDQKGLCSADGHVEPLGVAKETNVMTEVRGHQIGRRAYLHTREREREREEREGERRQREREREGGGGRGERETVREVNGRGQSELTVDMMITRLSWPWNSSTLPTLNPFHTNPGQEPSDLLHLTITMTVM